MYDDNGGVMANKLPKNMPRRNDIFHQEQEREAARLRRIGRGRKTGYVLTPYLENHERIFGETDIFRNLANN
jgi:hypothetical protein